MYNFNQNQLSTYLSKKDWHSCWGYLHNYLNEVSHDLYQAKKIYQDYHRPQQKKYIQDLSSLLSEIILVLLMTKEVKMSDEIYYRFILHHEVIHNMFYIAGLTNTDTHIQKFLQTNTPLSPSDQKKLCLLFSLNTKMDPIKTLENIPVNYRGAALLAYFGNNNNYCGDYEKIKIQLFHFQSDFEKMDFQAPLLTWLTLPYFGVSYIDYDDKHDAKYYINKHIQKYIKSVRTNQYKAVKETSNHSKISAAPCPPKLLLAFENFESNHAMYRCYSRPLAYLKKYFDVYVTVPEDCIDETARKAFPHVFLMNPKKMDDTFEYIEKLAPDVLFMPSVGMRYSNVILSNARWAPLQVMAIGHPAPTRSEYIDFVVAQETFYDAHSFSKDRFIVDPSPLQGVPNDYWKNHAPASPADGQPPNIIRVGITGALPKMSKSFFDMLEALEREATFPIQYVFLLNARGLNAIAVKKYILTIFPTAEVYDYQTYNDYIQKMHTLDIFLNQFPFGHTNTLIDGLLAGKPCVGLEARECHNKTVAAILKQINLDKQFLTYNIHDYKERFTSLCKDILNGKKYFFNPQTVYDHMFKETDEDNNFGRFLHWVYENRDQLKNSKDPYIYPTDCIQK